MEDQELRQLLRSTAEHAALPTAMPERMRRKVTQRRARTIGVTFLLTVAIVIGGLQGMRAVTLDEAAPQAPAGQQDAEEPGYEDWIDPRDNFRDLRPDAPTPEVPYVIDLATREMTPLPESITRSLATGRFDRFAASPNGSSLAFVGEGDEGTPQIFVAAIDGTGLRQVTHDPSSATSPAWSPDGTRIAYLGYGTAEERSLFVLDVATNESRQITAETRVQPTGPQFTPDGSSILYCGGGNVAPSNDPPVVRSVPVAGGKSTLLFGDGVGGMADACGGSISLDGSLITMMGSEIGGGGAVRFVANVDGTGLRGLPGRGSTPAGTWSPDGSRIVCRAYDDARQGILVFDLETKAASVVARGTAAIWLDDHTLLVDV